MHVRFPPAFAGMLIVILVLVMTTPRRRPGEPQTLFGLSLTLMCYVTAAKAPRRIRNVFQPITWSCLLALLGLYLHGLAIGKRLHAALADYLTERSPLDFQAHVAYRWFGGGGDILLYCLQPSVLALGICE